jgi:hypothetical protein
MAFNINEIKSALVYGGARQALFNVAFVAPPTGLNEDVDSINSGSHLLTRASSIPEARLGNIQVPYFGRKINLAGDRTFEPWSVTVINDEDFKIRNAMEAWSNAINNLVANVRSRGAGFNQYKTDATVTQYAKTGEAIRAYTFVGIYPSDVSAIELDWDATDRIEEFRVTFQYDYWVPTAVANPFTGNVLIDVGLNLVF